MESCLVNYGDEIYKDFTINSKRELVYRFNKAVDEKWSEPRRIDYNVIEFQVEVDVKGNVHIIYLDNKGLKYAVLTDEEVKRTALYNYNKQYYKIDNIKLLINKGRIDIFCMIYDSNNKFKSSIIHYERTRSGTKSYVVTDINLKTHRDVMYDVIYSKNVIQIFLNQYYNNENHINLIEYKNKWLKPKEVQAFSGKLTDFIIKEYSEGYVMIKVLNEFSIYILKREILDVHFNGIDSCKYSSAIRISDPLLVIDESDIWGFWKEKQQIMGASLNDEVILPQKVPNSGGATKMDYIIINNEKVLKQSLYGISDLRKPFLLKDIFKEELVNWKYDDDFYKGKEEVVSHLLKELNSRKKTMTEVVKKAKEIENLAKEKEHMMGQLNEKLNRISSENQNLLQQVNTSKSTRVYLENEVKNFKDKFEKEKAAKEKLQLGNDEMLKKTDLISNIQKEFEEENLQLKGKIKTVEDENRKLLNESEANKEKYKEEKIIFSNQINSLNKLIEERKSIEELLKAIEAEKNKGLLQRIFGSNEKNY